MKSHLKAQGLLNDLKLFMLISQYNTKKKSLQFTAILFVMGRNRVVSQRYWDCGNIIPYNVTKLSIRILLIEINTNTDLKYWSDIECVMKKSILQHYVLEQ